MLQATSNLSDCHWQLLQCCDGPCNPPGLMPAALACCGLGFVMLTRCCRGYFPHVPIDPPSIHCRPTSPTDMQGRRRPPTTDKPRENVPPVVTLNVSASCKDFYASDAERRLVQQAKATHRDTTASAERALKVSRGQMILPLLLNCWAGLSRPAGSGLTGTQGQLAPAPDAVLANLRPAALCRWPQRRCRWDRRLWMRCTTRASSWTVRRMELSRWAGWASVGIPLLRRLDQWAASIWNVAVCPCPCHNPVGAAGITGWARRGIAA